MPLAKNTLRHCSDTKPTTSVHLPLPGPRKTSPVQASENEPEFNDRVEAHSGWLILIRMCKTSCIFRTGRRALL